MATCNPVDRDNLVQNFITMPGSVVDNLRTIVVGPDYAARRYDATAGTGLVGPYDEVSGVSSAWPSLGASETVDTSTATVVIVNALVRYFTETASPPTVANGQQSGTTPNAIIHDGGSTIFAGTSRTAGLNADVEVGDYVYLADNGAVNTLETRVAGFGYTLGQPNILLLEDSLPAALQGGAFFNITLAQVADVITLTASDVTLTPTTVQADAGITAATTRTGSAYPVIGGQTFAGADLSVVYTSYRALRTANTTTILTIGTAADIAANFVGAEYPESELGFAVTRALAPVQSPALTSPPVVLAAALPGVTDADWSNLFSRIRRRRDWYTMAVLSTTASVHTLVESFIDSRALIGLKSRAVFSLVRQTENQLFSGSLGVTLSGGDLTITVASGQPFLNAVAGDTVTTDAGTYVIGTVTSAQEVVLTTAATGSTTLTEVVHPLTVAEQATDYGNRAAAFDNRGITITFPDEPTWNGETVQGYLLSAAVAGCRGYAMPHQSLKGVAMESGWAVPQCEYEFAGELETIAQLGTMVFGVCATDPDTAVVEFTQTTDQTLTIDSYEGLVANVDAIDRYFSDSLAVYETRAAKITSFQLDLITTTASSGLEFLRTNTVVNPFGPVLLEGTVDPAFQDPNDAVKVTVPITAVISSIVQNLDADITITLSTAG